MTLQSEKQTIAIYIMPNILRAIPDRKCSLKVSIDCQSNGTGRLLQLQNCFAREVWFFD